MTYETYTWICYIGAGLSVLCFITAVILFFKLNIISVIGDLSGATARRAIQTIREQNQAEGKKAYNPSKVNRERGKLTTKMTASGHLSETTAFPLEIGLETAKISQSENRETTLLSQPQLESGSNETTVLDSALAEPTRKNVANAETALLNLQPNSFLVEREITFTHSDEYID